MAKKKEEEENRKKQQWTTATLAPVEDNSTSGTKSSDAKEISEKEKLDPIRPAFAMQMGLKGMQFYRTLLLTVDFFSNSMAFSEYMTINSNRFFLE